MFPRDGTKVLVSERNYTVNENNNRPDLPGEIQFDGFNFNDLNDSSQYGAWVPSVNVTMQPEYIERVVEVPRYKEEWVERTVEIPQPLMVDRVVEVPQIQEVIKETPGPVHIDIVTREVPKVEIRQVERVVEVPQIVYRDRFVEVPVVHEVVRRIPRITVHEIPIERVIQVPKKVVQEIEQPIYRPVPHLVHCEVEHEIPVPLVQTQTVEMVNASYEDNTEPQVEIHKIVEKEIQVVEKPVIQPVIQPVIMEKIIEVPVKVEEEPRRVPVTAVPVVHAVPVPVARGPQVVAMPTSSFGFPSDFQATSPWATSPNLGNRMGSGRVFAEATSWSAGFGQMPTPPGTPRSATTPTPLTSFSMLRGAATPPMAHREALSPSPYGSTPYISPPLESAWNSSPVLNAQSMPLLRGSATPPMPPMMQSQFP